MQIINKSAPWTKKCFAASPMVISSNTSSYQSIGIQQTGTRAASHGNQQSGEAFGLPDEPPKSAKNGVATDSSGAQRAVDFHHMSSRQLMQWINTEISEGRMTLDESTKYVTMTINGMPVVDNGDPLGANDSWRDETRDYVNDLSLGIDGAVFRGDKEEEKLLRSMLKHLERTSDTHKEHGVTASAEPTA